MKLNFVKGEIYRPRRYSFYSIDMLDVHRSETLTSASLEQISSITHSFLKGIPLVIDPTSHFTPL